MNHDRRRYALVLLLLTLLSAPARAQSEPTNLEQARQDALEATKAYEDQNYSRAVELFSNAIDAGLDHPTLRYDLGNAYYKNGDLGRAILWYERARRAAPRDRDIQHNLAQARSQMQDVELSSHVVPVLLRPVTLLRDLLSLDGWSKLLALGLTALCAVAVWRQWQPRFQLAMRRAALVLVAVVAVSLSMTLAIYHEQYGTDSMIVVDEEVDVHSGPGDDYDLAFRVHSGLKVTVGERRGDWARIDLGGELVGWIPLQSAEAL